MTANKKLLMLPGDGSGACSTTSRARRPCAEGARLPERRSGGALGTRMPVVMAASSPASTAR